MSGSLYLQSPAMVGVRVSKNPSLRSSELKMRENLRKAKTAIFPHRFPRDMKHISFLILNIYKALMQDNVGKTSALTAYI